DDHRRAGAHVSQERSRRGNRRALADAGLWKRPADRRRARRSAPVPGHAARTEARRFMKGWQTIVWRAASAAVILSCGGIAQEITSQQIAGGLAQPERWLTYSGSYSGQRHSPLTGITPANVQRLTAQWAFQTGVLGKFETTPIVIDGLMYLTGPGDHAWAI